MASPREESEARGKGQKLLDEGESSRVNQRCDLFLVLTVSTVMSQHVNTESFNISVVCRNTICLSGCSIFPFVGTITLATGLALMIDDSRSGKQTFSTQMWQCWARGLVRVKKRCVDWKYQLWLPQTQMEMFRILVTSHTEGCWNTLSSRGHWRPSLVTCYSTNPFDLKAWKSGHKRAVSTWYDVFCRNVSSLRHV